MSDDKNIVVAIPNRSSSSQINAQLANFIHTLNSDKLPGDYSSLSVNFSYLQPVDANRNKMVKDFLQDEDNEWILMVDNDVVPPIDVLDMIDYGEKVVSATVTVKKDRVPQPVIVKQRDDGQFRQMDMEEYEEEVADNGLVEVDGVGTGCILVHRSVFEDIEPPWFRFIYNEDGTLQLGEDFYFGEKLRQNGYNMYISSEHVCSHFRKTDLTDFAQLVADCKTEE